MNLQTIIDNNLEAVRTAFEAYNIKKPITEKTLSAAIVLYATADGNPFLQDLISLTADTNNYEDFLKRNPVKKAAAQARKAEKKKARGGVTRVGSVIRKVVPKKAAPASTITPPKPTGSDPLTQAANSAADTTTAPKNPIVDKATQQPGSKVQDIITGVGNVLSAGVDAIQTIRGGGGGTQEDEENNNSTGGSGIKKYLPYIIGGGILLIAILFFALKKK